MSFQLLKNGITYNKKQKTPQQDILKEQINEKIDFPNCEKEKRFLNLVRNKIKKIKSSTEYIEDIKEIKLKEMIGKEEKLKELIIEKLNINTSAENFTKFDPLCSFEEISKKCKLKSNFITIMKENYSFKIPSPIQSTIIPVLFQNKNVIACSETGSGKTLSYLIPIMHNIANSHKLEASNPYKCVIILPTKELCVQVYNEVSVFSKYYTDSQLKVKVIHKSTMESCKTNFGNFIHNTDILIGTPMHINEILEYENGLLLNSVKYLILDEADQFFDYGYIETIDNILFQTKDHKICKGFFSATLPDEIEEILTTYIMDAVKITIGSNLAPSKSIVQQIVYCTNESGKLLGISNFFKGNFESPILIFVEGIANCEKLYQTIKFDIPNVAYLHSQMSRTHREEIVKKYRTGEIWALVCTDLISRGIDFKNVKTVINYDCPYNEINYIHRIGRTGRAGKAGKAITFVSDDDTVRLKKLAKIFKKSKTCECPNWILKLDQN